jgi:hypothetical protein
MLSSRSLLPWARSTTALVSETPLVIALTLLAAIRVHEQTGGGSILGTCSTLSLAPTLNYPVPQFS